MAAACCVPRLERGRSAGLPAHPRRNYAPGEYAARRFAGATFALGCRLGTPISRLASHKPPIGRLAFPGFELHYLLSAHGLLRVGGRSELIVDASRKETISSRGFCRDFAHDGTLIANQYIIRYLSDLQFRHHGPRIRAFDQSTNRMTATDQRLVSEIK
jgi:hypothetical protein